MKKFFKACGFSALIAAIYFFASAFVGLVVFAIVLLTKQDMFKSRNNGKSS